MGVGAGIALIVAGTVVGLLTVFLLWHRIPAVLALVVASACGMCSVAGGLLVQEDVGAAWAFALVLLAILAPCTHGWPSARRVDEGCRWLPRPVPPRRK